MTAVLETPTTSSRWLGEIRATVTLAVPLILTELAYMAIITTDIVMMGWLGPEALAAGSLSGHFYFFFEFFALGLLSAVAPIVAQHFGARRFRMVRRTFRQGLWLAVLLAVPCSALIWHAEIILLTLGQVPELASAGQAYVRAMVFGLLPGFWMFVLSQFLSAHMRPRAMLVVTILGIAVNGLANYALMFGHFGFPRLELVGAGISSAMVSTFMFAALLGFVLIDRRLRRYRLLGRIWRADWSALREIARVGTPIAVTELAETGMFVASGLLMGLLGTTSLAAHAIASQCAALAFMVPGGMAQAATVRVGRATGAGDVHGAARAGWTAVATVTAFSIVPATAFWFLGDEIIGLFLDVGRPENGPVITIAVGLLAVAAVFQFADAIQVVSLGSLRGLKDTTGPMVITLAGYWGLGLPAAALFGVHWGYGAQGIWIPLAISLAVVGLLLALRFRWQCRRLC